MLRSREATGYICVYLHINMFFKKTNRIDFPYTVKFRKYKPWADIFSNGFLLGFCSGKLIFGGAYYWREFCISKWVGIDNKTV